MSGIVLPPKSVLKNLQPIKRKDEPKKEEKK